MERIQLMSNVYLPFVSVYQRINDFVHTLAYDIAIRNSVTGVLVNLNHFIEKKKLDSHLVAHNKCGNRKDLLTYEISM